MGQAAEWARGPDQTADVSNVTIYGMMIACVALHYEFNRYWDEMNNDRMLVPNR